MSYIKAVEKGQFSKPSCNSFKVLKQFSEDDFTLEKLQCFLTLRRLIEPFSVLYETDWPLLPFLAEDIKAIALNFFKTFNRLKESEVIKIKVKINGRQLPHGD